MGSARDPRTIKTETNQGEDPIGTIQSERRSNRSDPIGEKIQSGEKFKKSGSGKGIEKSAGAAAHVPVTGPLLQREYRDWESTGKE